MTEVKLPDEVLREIAPCTRCGDREAVDNCLLCGAPYCDVCVVRHEGECEGFLRQKFGGEGGA